MSVNIHYGKRLDFSTCFIKFGNDQLKSQMENDSMFQQTNWKTMEKKKPTFFFGSADFLVKSSQYFTLFPPLLHVCAHTGLRGYTGVIKGCKEPLRSAVTDRRVTEINF